VLSTDEECQVRIFEGSITPKEVACPVSALTLNWSDLGICELKISSGFPPGLDLPNLAENCLKIIA
jgi:hypothetical protein